MREIASCLSDHSVRVSDYSCTNAANLSCHPPRLSPSIQNAVICTYITKLSTQKQFLIQLNWSKNALDQSLCISEIDHENPSPVSSVSKFTTQNRLFKKKKGHKLIEFNSLKVEVLWDISSAKFSSGPEPVAAFFVAVLVDAEMGLLLGDMGEDLVHKKFKTGIHFAQFSLISRREHFNGGTLYSTKAQFSQLGTPHDIAIRCEEEGLKSPALSISIDKRRVILVKRLQWNFRGNQTIFIDGLTVDLMWDVYDWLFDRANNGRASFMFRTRSVLDSRLWLEEKLVVQEFCLFICGSKN
ncbi:hypothetical protein Sjap_012321 [Stephania japonica]|uniref:DUF868 domain-containing protein n=1 Tax=Stephania japonica TaxID=461633 RepID=A0AAP0IVW0_9MAGN